MNKKFFSPSKRSFVEPFRVMQLLSDASLLEKNGKEVFHLELGEPQSMIPSLVKKEIKRILELNLPGYTPSNGIEELRNAVKKFYSEKYSVEINRDNVFITTGSSGAFLLTFLTCFDESKKVGVFNPVYPAYRNILKSLNIDILEIYPDESDICKIDLRKIEKYKFLDGLIISNPNNPNGQVFSDDELNFIYSFCKKNKIYLILDEIYHGIEYGAKTKSILNFGPNAIVINSFSKYFCLPGLRLGWVLIPDELKENFLKLSQNLFISSGNLSQYSAIKVFECLDELDNNVKKYTIARDIVNEKLSKIKGLKFKKPCGAFYYYLDLSSFKIDSEVIVKKILNDTGVVLTPGKDFDKKFGSKTARLAFSISNKIVRAGVDKIYDWFSKNY
jgi:aspartate/methionine/tyrosine aminotransferase